MTDIINNFTPKEKERDRALKDNFLALTPSQAEQYVEDNVTDLASAKQVMKKMAKIINSLAHKVTK